MLRFNKDWLNGEIMKEKNTLQKVTVIAYIVVFLLMTAFSIYMTFGESNKVYKARTVEQCEILKDYTKTTVEDSSAPAGLRNEYRFILSDINAMKDCLAFYVIHHYVQVFIDGDLVYSLTTSENNKIGFSPSSNWVFIPLLVTDNGKEILIVTTPVYKSVISREVEFLYGSRSDVVIRQLKADWPQITLSAICILAGLFFMIIQSVAILWKKSKSWDIFYLGNLLFLLGVWRITDTRISSIFFSKNPMSLGYITIAALFIAFVPMLFLVKDRFIGKKRTVLLLTALAVCISALVALSCQVFHIAELRETLLICHIMLIICIIVVIWASVTHNEKKVGEANIRSMILLLSTGALADLLFFLLNKSSSGVIFTIVALMIYTVSHFISEVYNMNKRIYVDTNTGLFNRSRWNTLRDKTVTASESIGVIMLDLNRLKYVNDTMGHNTGDKMIFDFANILRNNLPNDCMIFRWGGDEFVVLASDADKNKMDNLISLIRTATNEYNSSGEKADIYFAAGYALSIDYPEFSRDELLKKADEKMYRDKSEWYRNNVPDYRL